MRDLRNERSLVNVGRLVGCKGVAYQGKIAHEISDLLVFPLVDSLLDNTERHWLLDDIVIVGNNAFVDTAMEQSRGVMTTTTAQLARQS